jgi:hypothetical protein
VGVVDVARAHWTLDDATLVEILHALIAERRDAYLEGLLDRKMASVDVCKAADWKQVAGDLEAGRLAYAHRAKMLGPREGDRQGRAGP